jgi:hypothetical protein
MSVADSTGPSAHGTFIKNGAQGQPCGKRRYRHGQNAAFLEISIDSASRAHYSNAL